jgi:hypothetical protein
MIPEDHCPGFDQGQSRHELHGFWWLYLPVLFFCLRYAVHLFTNPWSGLESHFRGELGVVENLTVVILVLALCFTLAAFRHAGKESLSPLRVFLVLYCLGCIYFAGEEASWGQHWFGWATNEFFQAINDQQETNFHNTSKWLDRTPKGILSLAIFVGGIVMPVYIYAKSLKIDYGSSAWWLIPTLVCTPTAIFASMATWPSKIERYIDINFYFDQAQETKELYVAYFILLFIVSLQRRLAAMHQHPGNQSTKAS